VGRLFRAVRHNSFGEVDERRTGEIEMACECVLCGSCGGTGSIWVDFAGRYLGNRRCDDLDQMEPCEDCGGSGVIEVCYECQEAQDEDYSG